MPSGTRHGQTEEARADNAASALSVYPRTSEAKDCSQNANLHRPLMDMGMLEKS
jgi:hypothetical protein